MFPAGALGARDGSGTRSIPEQRSRREQMAQEQAAQVMTMKDTTANPAPLGLLGFGMTTVLLNMHNAGWFPLDSMILAMGIFYGGMAQVFAGVFEWKKGNTFGTVAFLSYGLFWMSLVGLIAIPKFGWAPAQNSNSFAAYLFMWGLFTLIMYFGTLKANRALQVVFFTLFVLFFLLSAHILFESKALGVVAGYEGIICGFSAIYAGLAQVLNEMYGRTVWPLGPVTR
jgi:succinate-acetate transporter protein